MSPEWRLAEHDAIPQNSWFSGALKVRTFSCGMTQRVFVLLCSEVKSA